MIERGSISLPQLSAFPITPVDSAGRVDLAALRRIVGRLVEAEVDSIGLLGSTGLYAYLTRDERRRALDAALDEVDRRVPILVGIGALRTDEAVRLAQDAKAAGAAAGLLAAMSYTPLSDDEVFAHFVAVAQESGLPICIYDNPATTHFTFSPALIGRLSEQAGIVAVKGPAADADRIGAQLDEVRRQVPPAFQVGFSVDWHAAEALIAGGDAWYSVAGGLFPGPCMALVKAVRTGDRTEARRINATLQPLWDTFRALSSLRVVYAAADLLGLCRPELPRPIQSLSAAARGRVAGVLKELGVL